MSKLDYRFQALNKTGGINKTGNKLYEVEQMDNFVIIDYKLKRFAYQPLYPPTRQDWRPLNEPQSKCLANNMRMYKEVSND